MTEPYTGDDLDAIRTVRIHAGHQLVMGRIREELERRRRELESDLDGLATAKCRGKLEALKTALAIPEILEAEISDSLKGDPKHGE